MCDSNMPKLPEESKVHHESWKMRIWEMLDRFDSREGEPSAMAKGMSLDENKHEAEHG